MILNKFIINPAPQLMPVFRISPFGNSDAIVNRTLSPNGNFRKWFTRKYPGYHWSFTRSGRDAIRYCMDALRLNNNDLVTILTTTGNFYISGCVTNQIERNCPWNREINSSTKVIFVNHEFGFPYENLVELSKYRLPVIEDCAHSFLSQNAESSVGFTGDYVVYSLPKFFPIQIGGIIMSRKPVEQSLLDITPEEEEYIESVLDYYIDSTDNFTAKRRENYKWFAERFYNTTFSPHFELMGYHVPGVFMFKLPSFIQGQTLKLYLQNNGIEASVFYRENSVFIPVHHNLSLEHLEYIYQIIIGFQTI